MLLWILQPVYSQDLADYEKHLFKAASGNQMPYRLLTPKPGSTLKKYPLIVFLHGAGERGADNEKQLVHGASLFLNPGFRSDYPCYVLFPQCPEGEYWASLKRDDSRRPYILDFDYRRPPTPSLDMALDLIRQMLRTLPIDRQRVYISGLSMGGMGTFEAVFRAPRLFAAAAPICGGGDAAAYRRQHARIPFWIFHGDNDSVISVEESRKMASRLRALGADVQYTEYPGIEHHSWINAFAEPDFIPWLMAQKR